MTIHTTPLTIEYVLDYTATFPVLGEQTVQIALSMDLATQEKHVRAQIGDANALAYTIDGDTYTFAIKYLGARRALFEVTQNEDGTITGHIYEYLGVDPLQISSIADFYITDEYVTVVGNKASGMIGFTGYICELYSTETGRMLAYEVKETQSISSVSVTFNTLWFDLADISGITSLKYFEGSEDQDPAFFVNNSSKAWVAKNYGFSGGLKIASRRFDIEFRTQYFYRYDAQNDSYETVAIEVPMFFVQEEVYEDLVGDVKSENKIDISVTVNGDDLTMLKSEYAEKTELLAANKDQYTEEAILDFIGEKITFN